MLKMGPLQETIEENDEGEDEISDAKAVAQGLRYKIQWEDLAVASTVLPDLEAAGRKLIEARLGYLPHNSVILRYEPYIRALIQNRRHGQMTDDEFYLQADDHIKLIRNTDMQHNTCLTYDDDLYRTYTRTFVPYGYTVKSRLTGFLGYEPQLEHSLVAELWLRKVMAQDRMHLPDYPTEVDYKAISLVKYREVLLKQGKWAADTSALVKMAC